MAAQKKSKSIIQNDFSFIMQFTPVQLNDITNLK